jgi:predicted transcriptional regulator
MAQTSTVQSPTFTQLVEKLQTLNEAELKQAVTLPDELQLKLDKGMQDFENGNYITNEQMKAKSAEWFTK